MKLALTLAGTGLLVSGCGHKSYEDFMNNSVSDQLGYMAVFSAVVFGGIFLYINRKDLTVLGETIAAALFMASLGAGLAFLNDPEGWLTMSRPTTITAP